MDGKIIIILQKQKRMTVVQRQQGSTSSIRHKSKHVAWKQLPRNECLLICLLSLCLRVSECLYVCLFVYVFVSSCEMNPSSLIRSGNTNKLCP